MKRQMLIAACCLAVFVAATAAQAATIDKVVTALKRGPIYVEPGTPGTTTNTAGELKQLLSRDDNIVVAVLPSGAVSGDPVGFARRLNKELGGKKIIGLAIGNQLLGYSALLPAGKASELMDRAKNVTQFPIETLETFVSNVHNWQAQNPQAEASKPAKPKKKHSGLNWWVVFLGAVLGALGAVWIYRVTHPPRTESISGEEFTKFRSPVRGDLEELSHLRDQVTDMQMRRTLTQTCKDIEAYFARFSTNRDDDAEVFRTHLANLNSVVRKYVEIQNDNPRYYDDAQGTMNSARQTVEDFSEFVVKSIKRGSRAQLTEFQVNTDILSAQRYK